MENTGSEMETLEHILIDSTAEPTKLSYALMRSVTDNFSNEIGRGGFGVVYMGNLRNGRVAVKMISNGHDVSDKQFLDEINCLTRARHVNIVRFLGYCSHTQGEVMEFNGAYVMAETIIRLLCFEYVPNGNLQHYLTENPHEDEWHLRYKMIRGICNGLCYLHEERISHLDLKLENVMLDAHMEAKITDFGLSRFLDEGQSIVFTKVIRGTPGYIAPEIINEGEISVKSDIYALGIIIIKLLTGRNIIDFDNWERSLHVDSPQVKSCMEIARCCIVADQHNRPTIGEIVHKLHKMEIMIQGATDDTSSSIYQVSYPFQETKMLDVYPRHVRFPLLGSDEPIRCSFNLTNKTDRECRFYIFNSDDNPFVSATLKPMSSISVGNTLSYNIQCIEDRVSDKLNKPSKLKAVIYETNLPNKETAHWAILTSVVFDPTSEATKYRFMDMRRGSNNINYIEVHPTEPWVLTIDSLSAICIWNWQTEERLSYNSSFPYSSPKFIGEKQWLVAGGTQDGSLIVYTCPTLDKVNEFKGHDGPITSLAVHSTRPFVLSASGDSIKLWDWSNHWSCIRLFEGGHTSAVIQLKFNPKDTNGFATLGKDGKVKIWSIDDPKHIATAEKLKGARLEYVFGYSDDRHMITAISDGDTRIWDLKKDECVHTLSLYEAAPFFGIINDKVVAVVCHPTRPLLASATIHMNIHVWDSATYRLKRTMNVKVWPKYASYIGSRRVWKEYTTLDADPIGIAFIGSRWLMVGFKEGVAILDIDVE